MAQNKGIVIGPRNTKAIIIRKLTTPIKLPTPLPVPSLPNRVTTPSQLLIANPHHIYTPVKGNCRAGRLQIGGTCWFQAIINPYLLSTMGRKILAKKLEEFESRNDVKPWKK
jgi:hypothetical protein